jgi:osmoprotectant transport system ATP-binding protein
VAIEFQGVTKQYPDGTVAVDNLSLTVEDSTITVLVGPSGCGKTTSLRMINRMVEPTAGTVLLDDKAKARRRAAELLETVGLPVELGKRYPAQLSGGQQQRVGVARALAADSPVLLMDEPFSAVDPIVREELQDELLRLQTQLGKTIVFVTHDIDEAVRLGDKVAVMRVGGKLAQYGTPADVLRHPVDDFVASFVGRDRGYRGLSFLSAFGVEINEVEKVEVGTRLSERNTGWLIAVNADGRPRGWLPPDSIVDGVVAERDLVAGGSLYVQGSPIRGALDAALSSPAGLGVVVDESHKVIGVVTARQVLEVIEGQPQSSAR